VKTPPARTSPRARRRPPPLHQRLRLHRQPLRRRHRHQQLRSCHPQLQHLHLPLHRQRPPHLRVPDPEAATHYRPAGIATGQASSVPPQTTARAASPQTDRRSPVDQAAMAIGGKPREPRAAKISPAAYMAKAWLRLRAQVELDLACPGHPLEDSKASGQPLAGEPRGPNETRGNARENRKVG